MKVSNIQELMAKAPNVDGAHETRDDGAKIIEIMISAVGTSRGGEYAAEQLVRHLMAGAGTAIDYFESLISELEDLAAKARRERDDRGGVWGLSTRAERLAERAEVAAEIAARRAWLALGAHERFQQTFGKEVTITPMADLGDNARKTAAEHLKRLKALRGK
jgi:hypothetical protein